MRVHVADHPLIAHKLTYLRDKRTDSPTFRRLADELVTLLAYEATREVRVEPFEIETPVAPTTGIKLASPKPLVVPILRAGLGMLDGMVRLLPTAEVGFLGMVRNEETLEATTYANRLPDDLHRPPVLRARPDAGHRRHPGRWRSATSSTAAPTTSPRSACWPRPRASPTSRSSSATSACRSSLVTGAIDERLNDKGYIVPGLGDAGDRLYGVV